VKPSQEEELIRVEQWAEIRRMHVVERLSIRRFTAARVVIARRSAVSFAPSFRLVIARRRGARSWIPSAMRSIACFAAILACRASECGVY
jgi:hypothetical protein